MDVAYVFHILQVFYLDVAYVLQWFQVFHVFFASVSDTCFICLQTYVANVSSGYFKSRTGVAHVAMAPMASRQQLIAGLRLLPRATHLALSSPLPPIPSLPSISPR